MVDHRGASGRQQSETRLLHEQREERHDLRRVRSGDFGIAPCGGCLPACEERMRPGGLRSSNMARLASSCDLVFACVLVFDKGNNTRKKKGSPSLTVPMSRREIAEQLRRHTTRRRPNWTHFDIQRRALRKEQAYFFHYHSRKILPPRRKNMRL